MPLLKETLRLRYVSLFFMENFTMPRSFHLLPTIALLAAIGCSGSSETSTQGPVSSSVDLAEQGGAAATTLVSLKVPNMF